MTKECIICGDFFEAVKDTRKYCDKCQRNSTRAQVKMKNAINASKHRMGEFDIPREKQCRYCGKTFLTAMGRKYCSKNCEDSYRIENNTCEYCGRKLFPEIKSTGRTYHPECREKKRLEVAKKTGRFRKCRYCEKEYIASHETQQFCSKTCSKAFAEAERTKSTEYTCQECGKVFVIPRRREFDKNPLLAWCSDACMEQILKKEELKKIRNEEAAAELKRTLLEKQKEAALKEEQEKFEKEVAKNGLCGFCNTPYKDCDLMQSGFRIKPKGARYNDNSKIIECPKFMKEKPKKKKQKKNAAV